MTLHISEFVVPLQMTSCRLATVSNVAGVYYNGTSDNGVGATLTTASPTLTVDSVAVANNDSVLLSGQTTAYQNGIYMVSGVGTAVVLTRRSDFQCALQMTPGHYLSIDSGTTYSGTFFVVAAPAVVAVGSSSVIFSGPPVLTPPTTMNLANSGLNIYNVAQTHLNHIVPTSDITADRQFSLVTGDQATSLDLSAAVNLAPGVFGGTLASEATKFTARTDLGIKIGNSNSLNVTNPVGNLFTTPTIVATDVVVLVLSSCTTPAYIVGFVPSNGSISVSFNVAPGANTVITYYAAPTI